MRFIPESGGLVLGRSDTPQLDIVPAPGLPFGPGEEVRRRALTRLAAAMARELHFPSPRLAPDFFRPTPASPSPHVWIAIARADEREAYVLRLGFPARPLEGLRILEEEEGGLPAWLIAPFVLLAWAGQDPRSMPEEQRESFRVAASALTFLVHRHEGGQTGRLRPLDRKAELPRLLRRIWEAPDPEAALEAFDLSFSGVDTALLAIEAGKALWDPESLPSSLPTPAGFFVAISLARIAGEGAGLMPWVVRDWSLWLDLVRSRKAGRPLPPPDWPPPEAAYTRGLHVLQGEAPSADPDLARGLHRALMEIAAREARYVPAGRFRVRAPELPLFRHAGVTAIRVAADPRGLWIQFLGDRGPGEIFRFDRELPPRPDMAADPAWLAAAAALWHDLTVGVPRAPRERGEAREAPARERREAPPERPAILPRPFVVRGEQEAFIGLSKQTDKEPEVDWGEREERERIARAAHAVRGHLRRLPPGWKPSEEARTIAMGFGVVVPDGYTFVRPHVRGGRKEEKEGEAEAPGEREAVARGLRSLALLGGG